MKSGLEVIVRKETPRGPLFLCACHHCGDGLVLLQESQLSFRKSCGCLREDLKEGKVYNGRKLIKKNVEGRRHLWRCEDCGFEQLAQVGKIKKQKQGCKCKRKLTTLTVDGETYTIREAAKKFGIGEYTIHHRRRWGWTDLQVLGLAPSPRAVAAKTYIEGEWMCFAERCMTNGVNVSTARGRVARGWSIAEAVGDDPHEDMRGKTRRKK